MKHLYETIFDTTANPEDFIVIETPLDAVEYIADAVASERKIAPGEFDRIYKEVKKHSSRCLCDRAWDICNMHSADFIRNNGGMCFESLVLFGNSPRIMILDDPWVTAVKRRSGATVLYIENAYPIEVDVKPDRTLSIEVPTKMREISVGAMFAEYSVFSVYIKDQKQLENLVARIKRDLKK